MKQNILEQTRELITALEQLEDTNPAAWKARRKVESAFSILDTSWCEPEPKTESAKPESGKVAKVK